MIKRQAPTMIIGDTQQGFTLVEIIIGIVVFALSLSVITSLILPTASQSASQLQQIRASELGQSLMNEILSRAYDENSDKAGGLLRCGESGAPACSGIGRDESNREDFDDVDDYHNLAQGSIYSRPILNAKGEDISNLYRGFSISVSVNFDSNFDNSGVGNGAKLITITVTAPTGDEIIFSSYKENF